jgi:hypothetical protein
MKLVAQFGQITLQGGLGNLKRSHEFFAGNRSARAQQTPVPVQPDDFAHVQPQVNLSF